jgi:hypothetical protein
MTNHLFYFINTRLQPGAGNLAKREPFQRLSSWAKTVETVFVFFVQPHRAEAPVSLENIPGLIAKI